MSNYLIKDQDRISLKMAFEDIQVEAVRRELSWEVWLLKKGIDLVIKQWTDEQFSKVMLLAIGGESGLPEIWSQKLYEEIEPLFSDVPQELRLIP